MSGAGTNMAALLYASRLPGAAYEIVLVASNNPDAAALKLAEAEGLATFALDHRGMDRAAHDTAMDTAIRQAGAEYIALVFLVIVKTVSENSNFSNYFASLLITVGLLTIVSESAIRVAILFKRYNNEMPVVKA